VTSTTVGHPALRGRAAAPVAVRRRRPPAILGTSTYAFWLLVAIVAVLNMFGLLMVLSASSVASARKGASVLGMFERQAGWTVAGTAALVLGLVISLDFWRRHVRLWLFGSIGLLALVLVPGLGNSANGATRWLAVGPIPLQPSEFAKFGLLLFVADLLDRRTDKVRDYRWGLLPVCAYLAVVAGLIMLQPNLGTTIIIAVMTLTMLLVAGVPLPGLLATGAVGVAGAAVAIARTPFRRARFFSFLNPWADPTGVGMQNVQALVGTANGGWFGRGLGQSRAKWGFLPEAHNDFIFAIIGEETGLIGAMTVVLLFFVLAVAGGWVAVRARDRFSMLVATGITTWLVVQALMNVGAVIGLMPITGVPLPFVSFGGSSLVVNLAATGVLLNIARHPAEAAPRPRRRPAR
jgi:cell division protein FtsW